MENPQEFWTQRYATEQTGWDMGQASPPLTAFLQQWKNKEAQILIPGAGNAHEALWLHKQGFKNVHVLDVAKQPLENLKARCPDFPKNHLHQANFFEFSGQFDLIIEQTFYCAINPTLRDSYVHKVHQLLKSHGQLYGVLFTFPLSESGPPFGGSQAEYKKRFSDYFRILKLEPCYNSIVPRQGKEAFVRLLKIT
jgi:thiopurine S-methyltransferase